MRDKNSTLKGIRDIFLHYRLNGKSSRWSEHFACSFEKSLLFFILLSLDMLIANSFVSTAKHAISHTSKIEAQGLELEIYKKEQAKAGSAYLPVLDFDVYGKIEKSALKAKESVIEKSTNYAFTLRQNIYNGGYDESTIKMTQQDVKMSTLAYENVKQTVLYEALMSHISLLGLRTLVKNQKSLLKEYQSLLTLANTKAEYGDGGEKVELESRYYQAKMKYLELKEQYALQQLTYKRLTGDSPESLKFDLKIKRYLVVDPSQVKLKHSNATLQQQLLKIRRAEHLIDRGRSKLFPKVDLEFKAYKTEPLAGLDYAIEDQYSIRLNVGYTLYNAHRDTIENEMNQLRKLQLVAQKDDLHTEIKSKYRELYTQYTYSAKHKTTIQNYIKSERERYYRYKKIFKLSQQKSIVDLLNALTSLHSAKALSTANLNSKMVVYLNILFLQSKLNLRALK